MFGMPEALERKRKAPSELIVSPHRTGPSSRAPAECVGRHWNEPDLCDLTSLQQRLEVDVGQAQRLRSILEHFVHCLSAVGDSAIPRFIRLGRRTPKPSNCTRELTATESATVSRAPACKQMHRLPKLSMTSRLRL